MLGWQLAMPWLVIYIGAFIYLLLRDTDEE